MPPPNPPLPRKWFNTEAPDNLVEAFENMCRENEWTKGEVLEVLLEFAVSEGPRLAFPVHRLRVRKKRCAVWQPEKPSRSDQ